MDAEPGLCTAIGQVCTEAAAACRATAQLPGPATLTIHVSRSTAGQPSVVTDRRSAVHVVYQALKAGRGAMTMPGKTGWPPCASRRAKS